MEKLDLRVQKTYRALIEAFENLLKEKEFETISVKEICEVALIGRPTFYKHFLDKYDFLTFYMTHKMSAIFDHALENLDDEDDNFFILVFQQLLDQFDNLSFLIFSLQMNSDIIIELESIQEYGQKMLKKQLKNKEKNKNDRAVVNEYEGQIIMGLTIQSVIFYKTNKETLSREKMIEMYKETLEKLRA